MNVRIVTRHTDVPKGVLARAEELAGKLQRYDPRLTEVELIFEEQKRTCRVEAILHLDRVDHVHASAEDDEFRPAVDQLMDRLQRQLRDQREKATQHQAEKG